VSARVTDMRDFIEAMRAAVPYLHPCAQEEIHWQFVGMRDAADNPAFMAKVRQLIADQLRFKAANA
jgi:hypothetical protein